MNELEIKRALKIIQDYSSNEDFNSSFIYPSKTLKMPSIGCNIMNNEKMCNTMDLKSRIYTKCLSLNDKTSIMINLTDMLVILSEYNITAINLKSSNIFCENEELKLSNICLDQLGRKEHSI